MQGDSKAPVEQEVSRAVDGATGVSEALSETLLDWLEERIATEAEELGDIRRETAQSSHDCCSRRILRRLGDSSYSTDLLGVLLRPLGSLCWCGGSTITFRYSLLNGKGVRR
jgi:hypothetical protein